VTEDLLATSTNGAGTDVVLEVSDLTVGFPSDDGLVQAVRGVSYGLRRGEVLGIVGESGSGKSVTSLAVMGLLPGNAKVSGSVRFRGKELLGAPEAELNKVRGRNVAMIFQDPMTSLNPVYTIGAQISEAIQVHERADKNTARRRSIDLLKQVGIPNADSRVDNYPHEFSGGMRQRAMIAMALACNPDVLIADEPTTALDVTIQAQIIELIDRLKDEFNSAVILITHDLGVVADVANEIVVMYAGRVVERAPTRQLFYDPQHPYTWGLLGSIPRLDRPKQERLHSIKGTPPSLINAPAGCKFRPRCPHAFEKCKEEPPLANRVEEAGHLDRCWLSVEDKRRLREPTLAGTEEAA
jgi:oligopeptide/dipeptide ABC transporter ATP-binding protein